MVKELPAGWHVTHTMEALAKALGDGWGVVKDVHDRHFLQGPDRMQVWVGATKVTGQGWRLRIRGDTNINGRYKEAPSELRGETLSISVAFDKPAFTVADDIKRRLLPGYGKVLARLYEIEAQDQSDEKARLELCKRFAEAWGGKYEPRNGQDNWRYMDGPGSMYLYNISASPKTMQFEVRSCPADLAVKIAETVRQYGEEKKKH